MKQLGNSLFKVSNFQRAIEKYQKAVRYLHALHPCPEELESLTIDQKKEYFSIKISSLLNESMCHLKLEAFQNAKKSSSNVIDTSKRLLNTEFKLSNQDLTKAYFRRGLACLKMNAVEESIGDLGIARGLDGNDKLIERELFTAEKLLRERRAKEKKAYSRMFD